MTVGDWFVLLGYAALATTAGSLLLRRFGFQDPLVANWGACLLCGQMLLTLAMLTTAFVPWRLPQLGPTVIAGTALLALVERVVTRRRGPAPGAARRTAAEVGLLLLPLLLFPNLVFVVQHMPPIAWDARSIWFLHGRFLTLAEGIDPALFADPRISWSHPDYPLHLSAQSAWIAWLRGAWSDVATRSFLLVTFAATFRLALAVFAAPGRPAWLALLLAIVLMAQCGATDISIDCTTGSQWVSGHADLHYAGPLVLALLAASTAPAARTAPLVVLLLGIAANVKNEGTAYVVLLAMALAAGRMLRWWRRRAVAAPAAVPAWRPHRRLIAFGAVIGGLPLLLWYAFRFVHSIDNDLGLGSRLTDPALVLDALAARGGTVAARLVELAHDNGTGTLLLVWLLVAAASLLAARSGADMRPRRHEWWTAAAAVASTLLIGIAYVLTPHDLEWHLSTSAGRLLLLPHLLVFALCVFRLDVLAPVWTGSALGTRLGAWRSPGRACSQTG